MEGRILDGSHTIHRGLNTMEPRLLFKAWKEVRGEREKERRGREGEEERGREGDHTTMRGMPGEAKGASSECSLHAWTKSPSGLPEESVPTPKQRKGLTLITF